MSTEGSVTDNDRIILDEVLVQSRATTHPSATASDFFEFFTVEQVLKDSDLSYDEIESGLVGDAGDGGIDGIYLLVNGDLVQEDLDYSYLKKQIDLHLIIVQSKTSPAFKETPVERFITVSEDILDLSKEPEVLRDIYGDPLLEAIERFRSVYTQLATKFPTFRVSYYYASKGGGPALSIVRKVEKLEAVVKKHFPTCRFAFRFLGASELLALARRRPQTTHPLTLAENPISSEGQVGFVCLVRLGDFYEFITDSEGELRRQVFEANVRDYQGRTEVNDEIQKSLQENSTDDFWWLNNGISILASNASLGGKVLTIEDPQIVNGLQTSTEVYNYCRKFNTDGDQRKILIRVIVPDEGESRDRIIKATNSQTSVQQASLRATDKIHHDIEQYLRPRGLFYDRRKNYYKNEGKPREKVIGIPYLGQAVMAILLQRPDTARGRPSSLLKKDEDYAKIYNVNYPIKLYHVCAEAGRRVETYIRSSDAALSARDRNNLRFYVAMHAVASLGGKWPFTAEDIASIDINDLDMDRIKGSTGLVRTKYEKLGGNDQVAKGPLLLEVVKRDLETAAKGPGRIGGAES